MQHALHSGGTLCLGAAALLLSGCQFQAPLGSQWDRSDLAALEWAPLHGASGAEAVAAGDGDYACSVERLRVAAQGQIAIVEGAFASAQAEAHAENLAYARATRRDGAAGSTARSFCSVLQSFGALMGAN